MRPQITQPLQGQEHFVMTRVEDILTNVIINVNPYWLLLPILILTLQVPIVIKTLQYISQSPHHWILITSCLLSSYFLLYLIQNVLKSVSLIKISHFFLYQLTSSIQYRYLFIHSQIVHWISIQRYQLLHWVYL